MERISRCRHSTIIIVSIVEEKVCAHYITNKMKRAKHEKTKEKKEDTTRRIIHAHTHTHNRQTYTIAAPIRCRNQKSNKK